MSRTGVFAVLFLVALGAEETTSPSPSIFIDPFYDGPFWDCSILVVIVKSSDNTSSIALESKFARVRKIQELIYRFPSEHNLTLGTFSMTTLLIDRSEASNRTSRQLTQKWGSRYKPTNIEEALRTSIDHPEDWRTLDESMAEVTQNFAVNTTGHLMIWLSSSEDGQQANLGGVRETYERLIDRYGYRSVGLSEEEFEETMRKLEVSDSFRREYVLID